MYLDLLNEHRILTKISLENESSFENEDFYVVC
jgi:hypothetical protein